jgi:hypothetical protein
VLDDGDYCGDALGLRRQATVGSGGGGDGVADDARDRRQRNRGVVLGELLSELEDQARRGGSA